MVGAVALMAALAASAAAQGLKIDPEVEVAAVLFAASATQAAFAKSLDARLQAQGGRIARLAAELKAGDARHRVEKEHPRPPLASDPRIPRVSTFRRRRTQTLAEFPQIVRNRKAGNKLNVLVPKLPRNPHA
jgi:hypothetical protein